MFEIFPQQDLRLANQATLASSLQSPHPKHWDTNTCHHTGLFLWMLGLGLHDV